MDEVTLDLNDRGRGAFYIMHEQEQLGKMDVGISGGNLVAYHTEVSPEAEGKGYAKKLLNAMVDHARANHLKVVPLCSYVHAQFQRSPNEYADVWQPKER